MRGDFSGLKPGLFRGLLAATLIIASGLPLIAQGPPTQLFVVADKSVFTWGESNKVTATARDAQGSEVKNTAVIFTVDPPTAATVSAAGVITPLQLTSFAVNAAAGTLKAQIYVQVIPSRITVFPSTPQMTVGTTQLVTATAFDANGKPIPAARFQWELRNALGAWREAQPMASLDAAGNLQALVEGRLLVTARISYPLAFVAGFLSQALGSAYVQMAAPRSYSLSRVFLGKAVSGSSKLTPATSPLLVTEAGAVQFVASLDGTGSALLEWSGNGVRSLLASGRAEIGTGQPLVQMPTLAGSHDGNLLVAEVDAGGTTQISGGASDGLLPVLVPGTPLDGASDTSEFSIQRNSIADGGYKAVAVRFTDAVTGRNGWGLYRGISRPLSEPVVTFLDGFPGYPSATFYGWVPYGIASDGTVWVLAGVPQADGSNKGLLFRCRPGSPPEKILGDGELFLGDQVRYLVPGGLQSFFVASNGDLVARVQTSASDSVVRWPGDGGAPQVLKASAGQVYWHEPGVGSLIALNNYKGLGSGLFLWDGVTSTPLLTVGSTALDGSPVREIVSAAANSMGVIYAMVRTDANAMLIARLRPDTQVVLRAGENIPLGVPPLINALVRGAPSGTPFLLVGGTTQYVARLSDAGTADTILGGSAVLPGGSAFHGTQAIFSYGPDRFLFADSGTGVYSWSQSTVNLALRTPAPVDSGLDLGTPVQINVNRAGAMAGLFWWGAASGIYRVKDGKVTKVVRFTESIDGIYVAGADSPLIDESGNVTFTFTDNQNAYVARWDGLATHIILGTGTKMPDGRTVVSLFRSHGVGNTVVTNIGLDDGQHTNVTYTNGHWDYVAGKNDRLATGEFVSWANYDVFDGNSKGDSVFFFGGSGSYTNGIAARVGGTFRKVLSLSDFTPDGDTLIAITQITIDDDDVVHILASNDSGQQVIYRATPVGLLPNNGVPAVQAGGIGPLYSSSSTLQPGSWVSIYGVNLASRVAVWNGDFPTKLADVTVTINGKLAYLWFVSPGQINLQVPDDTATGPVTVVITNAAGTVTATVNMAAASPSLSLLGDGQHLAGVIATPDGKGTYGGGSYDLVGPTGAFAFSTRPVHAGETLVLYGVGFGPTNPKVPSGKPFSGSAPTVSPATVTIGGVAARVLYSGMTGAGLYQINLIVPDAGSGDKQVVASCAGTQTAVGPLLTIQ